MKTSVILAASTALLPLSSIAAETISCDALPTCAELGYTETVAQCPGKYLVCPFDRTLGTCIHDAKVGQIGYFTKDPGNGWLLCDGKIYNAKKYPDLADALDDKYILSSTRIQVPDYRGDFLRVFGGNSGTVNTRQAEGLPNITGSIGSNAGRAQYTVDSSSGAFYKTSTGKSYYSNEKSENGALKVFFDASKSNFIYGASSNVTPVNTAVYAYIYAGKVDNSAGSPTFPSCSKGQYYYADGTCSSSYDSSKTLLGIITSANSSARLIAYLTGGVSHSTKISSAIAVCQGKGGSLPSYGSWSELLSKGISTSVVKSPQASKYYWNSSSTDLIYCSSASSCSFKSNTNNNGTATSSAYYYCIHYTYYAE